MADKMNMNQYLANLDLVEVRKESRLVLYLLCLIMVDRKVGKDENVYDLRAKWPLIFGASGNETHLHYYFYIKLRFGSPEEAEKLYKAAQQGS